MSEEDHARSLLSAPPAPCALPPGAIGAAGKDASAAAAEIDAMQHEEFDERFDELSEADKHRMYLDMFHTGLDMMQEEQEGQEEQ